MNVYLIRSAEYNEEQFNEVVAFLNKHTGPVRFESADAYIKQAEEQIKVETFDKDRFYTQEDLHRSFSMILKEAFPVERRVTTWENLFDVCNSFRHEQKITKKDFAIVLTQISNKHNWFSALDPLNTNNGFVHTGDWQYYVRCSDVFPIAYLIASLVLQKHMFSDYDDLKQHIHQWPLGCINDYCEDKKQIILKLRTADICWDCMQLLSGKVDISVVEQMLRILESVRSGMLFHQNFRQNLKPSVLRISKSGEFQLVDYNKDIKLYPLEKVLYLFYLNHPEGIPLTHLVDFKEELRQIYFRFAATGSLPTIYKSIDDLVNVNTGSASQKIAKINKNLKNAIGEELAKHYIIAGDKSERRKILIPRGLIINELL